MNRPVKWTLRIVGVVVALLLLLGIAAVFILPSAWFRDKVRNRMVYEIERVSGGKTEIGEFRVDWKTLTAEVAPFVLRGAEPLTERPLFRAESVKVGLKIISVAKKDIDIASLLVEAPQVNILVDAEGKTNFPGPKIKRESTKDPIQQLLDLAVGTIDLRNGWIQYADRRMPLTLQGENLQAQLAYNVTGPSYRGNVAINKLTMDTGKTDPMAFDVKTQLGLYSNRIQVESARLALGTTTVEVAGTIEGFKEPRVDLQLKADAALADVARPLKLPVIPVGRAQFAGKLAYASRDQLLIEGRIRGSGLAVHESGVRINDIGIASDVRFTTALVQLRGTRVQALGGTFAGMVDVHDLKTFKVNGRVDGISVATASQLVGARNVPYSGGISGPVEIAGTIGNRDLRAGGTFKIAAGKTGVPVNGSLEVAYDQRRNALQLGNSHLVFPSSRLDVTGTLGSALKVRLETKDLNDLMPAITMAGGSLDKLPMRLEPGGSGLFEGTVTGPVKTARVNGTLTLTDFKVQDQRVDRLVASLDATSSGAHIASFGLGQETLRLEGSADIALQDWKLVDAGAVSAKLKLQGAQIEKLLVAAGQKLPIEGQLSATATVEGTAGDPRAALTIDVLQPIVYGEKLDRFRAQIKYAGAGVEVIDGVAQLGTARVLLAGSYQHAVGEYKNGRLRLNLSTQGFSLDRVGNIQRLRPGVAGRLELKATVTADVRNGDVQPNDVNGLIALRDLVVDGRAVGSFTIDANTSGRELAMTVAGNLRGSKVSGKAAFQLAGDYPGSGSVDFSSITFSTLQDLALAARGSEPMPFDGFVEGRLTFSGPAKKPEAMRARLDLPSLQLVPARRGLTPNQARELSVQNQGPVVLEYDGKAIQIRSAHLIGRDTDLRASGSVNLNDKSPWDLRVDGTLNLGIAQDFNSDIVSSGVAAVNGTVRGSLADPQVVGRLELKDASFSVTDIPNGLDNANGVILLDRRRATIERLTAETGGGAISFGGFVGFGAPEMTYRLTARAENVRVRYPEGVSTTVSSNLSLTGTSAKSMLTGVVTVKRAGFNPRTDVGGILASSARPVATPTTPNPFLRGMQLDIKIESAPNLQFQTALTNDLQAEADLRVRGTAAKPSLLGRIVVNQGEVQFFGTKYTINRGEIAFYNPAKIEPVLDMDLETRVRGVLVTINFTGPLSKLNASYRSDPPLQSNEIVALLAVGRAPGTNSSLASGQTVATQSFMSTGTNTLLGQAVAAPISGRLQRFFGVSKLKIDPQLTGINAVPQARLTVEQQVSRDVTLTYITNLAEANQQIIRVEWDINRSWSVVALREENGAFGIDFFFKKRFK
ncbi:MAG TPA: translocation/assembly module TamB domain-containing protein [Bryobacteraceae bacterium]|nr:translocation/assembly module TamB domain-containing protein [Bryobacteraceae bacterium]